MTYNHKGTDLQLPLTIESIENNLKEIEETLNSKLLLPSMFDYLRAELYRDVLMVIRTNAGHAATLAEAALRLETLLSQVSPEGV